MPSSTFSTKNQPAHPLTLIPGPVEFDDKVLEAMGHYSVAHTAKPFLEVAQAALKSLRTLFFSSASDSQPFIINGSGTLGWDIAAANLVERGDDVLLLNTGFFSSSWAEAFRAYGVNVTELKAEIGQTVPLETIERALKENPRFKAVTVTHVDTSTAVVSDVQAVAQLARKHVPDALVLVDGVCSIGVEPLRFDDWGLDFVLTASQKAIGVPSGLSISIASGRALARVAQREAPVPSFFASLKRWLPIMQAYEAGKPAYFATPSVQLFWALKTALDQIAPNAEAVEQRWADHRRASDKVKDTLENELGIRLVAQSRDVAAHGLTAAYLPDGWELPNLLPPLLQDGFVLAGGILPPIAQRYFRIGHMNVSIYEDHIDRLLVELKQQFSKK